MVVILEQLANRSYKASGQNTDALNITLNDVMIPKINSVVNRICKGIYINPMNQQKFTSGDLPFLRKQQFYNIVQSKPSTVLLVSGGVTITVDTTDFASSGAVMIDGEVIEYTGKTATTLTGCTGINSTHQAGTNVYQLYVLPSNMSNPFTVYYVDVNGNEKEIPYKDSRYSSNSSMYYTIVQNNTPTSYFHFYGYNGANDKIMVKYYINSVDMVNLIDTCIIPDTRCLDMVSMLVAGELAYENEEIEDASTKLQLGTTKLNEMYVYYTSQIKRNKQQIQAQPYDFSNIYGGYGIRGQIGKRR